MAKYAQHQWLQGITLVGGIAITGWLLFGVFPSVGENPGTPNWQRTVLWLIGTLAMPITFGVVRVIGHKSNDR